MPPRKTSQPTLDLQTRFPPLFRLMDLLAITSQRELATYLGLSPQSITSAVVAQRIPIDWYKTIALKEKLDFDRLIPYIERGEMTLDDDRELRRLMALWKELSISERKALCVFAQGYRTQRPDITPVLDAIAVLVSSVISATHDGGTPIRDDDAIA